MSLLNFISVRVDFRYSQETVVILAAPNDVHSYKKCSIMVITWSGLNDYLTHENHLALYIVNPWPKQISIQSFFSHDSMFPFASKFLREPIC